MTTGTTLANSARATRRTNQSVAAATSGSTSTMVMYAYRDSDRLGDGAAPPSGERERHDRASGERGREQERAAGSGAG